MSQRIVPAFRLPICDDEIQDVVKTHCGSIPETAIDDAILAEPLKAYGQGWLVSDGAFETDFMNLKTRILPSGTASLLVFMNAKTLDETFTVRTASPSRNLTSRSDPSRSGSVGPGSDPWSGIRNGATRGVKKVDA